MNDSLETSQYHKLVYIQKIITDKNIKVNMDFINRLSTQELIQLYKQSCTYDGQHFPIIITKIVTKLICAQAKESFQNSSILGPIFKLINVDNLSVTITENERAMLLQKKHKIEDNVYKLVFTNMISDLVDASKLMSIAQDVGSSITKLQTRPLPNSIITSADIHKEPPPSAVMTKLELISNKEHNINKNDQTEEAMQEDIILFDKNNDTLQDKDFILEGRKGEQDSIEDEIEDEQYKIEDEQDNIENETKGHEDEQDNIESEDEQDNIESEVEDKQDEKLITDHFLEVNDEKLVSCEKQNSPLILNTPKPKFDFDTISVIEERGIKRKRVEISDLFNDISDKEINF